MSDETRPDLDELIADADGYAVMDEYPGAVLIRDLASALSAERERSSKAEHDAAQWRRQLDLQTETSREEIKRADGLEALIERAKMAAHTYPNLWDHIQSRDDFLAIFDSAPSEALSAHNAEVWEEGVRVALNHAIRNEDGITLRLQHLDDTPWINPYSGEPVPIKENRK